MRKSIYPGSPTKLKHRPGGPLVLSQTATYALQAVYHLAGARASGEPVRVDDLARELGVPRNYLSKVLHALARAGILESTRGPGGGFALRTDPGRVSLAQIVDPFDDISGASSCLLGRPECSDATPCAAHAQWKAVSASVRRFFEETTLQKGLTHPPLMPGGAVDD